MAIELFDGNNVSIRAATRFDIHTRNAMNLRLRYHGTTANHIWVWDGKDHNERRRELYPEYKTHREPLGEDIFSHIRLWRELLRHSPAAQIEVPLWEADDVIATLARKFASRGTEVLIHSNDADYLQLTANPLIKIIGIQKPPAEGKWIPLYKACVGDPSDNIRGIPGFGKGTWEALSRDYDALLAAVRLGSYHSFESLPLPKRVKTWLAAPGHIELVQKMLIVTHFYSVPDEELNQHIVKGTPDQDAANELLRKYLL